MNASERHDQPTANIPRGVRQLWIVVEGGAEPVASPTETPQRWRNARLNALGPIDLALFQELDAGAQP